LRSALFIYFFLNGDSPRSVQLEARVQLPRDKPRELRPEYAPWWSKLRIKSFFNRLRRDVAMLLRITKQQ